MPFKFLRRLKLDKPWDWAGLACLFLAIGFALMTEVSWWRWFEYAAGFCGVVTIILEHESDA